MPEAGYESRWVVSLALEEAMLCAERGWTRSKWLSQPVEDRVWALAERRIQGIMRAVEDQEMRIRRKIESMSRGRR